MNKPPLRALIAEDSEDDALLLARHLQQGYELTHLRVDTPDGLRQALQQGEWDVVLSDHSMPNFDSFDALQIVRQSGRDLPFIIVSGTMGEDLAVEAIKAGVNDYLLKNNLKRLLPAIERELQAAQARHAQSRSELLLSKLFTVVEQIADSVYITGRNGV